MNEPVVRNFAQENFHIHGCFASFFRGVLDWFDTKFYTKFNTVVIGSYDKAVEYFKKKQSGEKDVHALPAIALDPMYDFGNEERGGRFLWQFARYGYPVGCYLSESIDLKEQDITVTPIFSRYQGTFEITMWLQSVYELMDLRVNLIQICGGYGRWLRPEYFWSYLIFPDGIRGFKKNGKPIDWGNTNADIIHIDTINQHKLAIPIPLNAIWKMDSCSDATTKYGADSVADYKMQATFTYEVNLPTYTVLNNMVNAGIDKSMVPGSDLSFTMSNTIARYPLVSPSKVIKYVGEKHSAETISKNVYNLFEKDFVLYDIVKTNKTKALLMLPDSISVYPKMPEKANYIVSGVVKLLDDDTDMATFSLDKCDILLIRSYKDSYLTYLRRCNGVISLNDTESSEFYNKVAILRKPCICNINSNYHDKILSLVNTPVTIDPLRGCIYDGLHRIHKVRGDDALTYKISEMIKKKFPKEYEEAIRKIPGTKAFWKSAKVDSKVLDKKLISDKCDGTITDFYLGFHLSVDSLNQCQFYVDDDFISPAEYYLTTTNITFKKAPPAGSKIYLHAREEHVRECKLAAIYTYTQDDLNSDSVLIQLPYHAETIDDFSLVTYVGELEYDKEYKFNIDNQTVEVLVKPVVDEIIQIFYYLK